MTTATPPSSLAPEPFFDPETGFSGWRVRLSNDKGIPTPAIANGRVFVGGGFGSYDFYALDANTGELVWHKRTSDDGPTAAVVYGDFVAFNTESCTLEVVSARTGETIWNRWLGDPLLAQPAIGCVCVFMAYPKGGGHALGAFRLRDGEPLWRTSLPHDVTTAPVFSDGKIFVSTMDGTVRRISIDDGAVEWSREMNATSAPWVDQGEVYVAHKADRGPDSDKDRPLPLTAKEAPHERVSAFDADHGHPGRSYDSKAAMYLDKDWGSDQKDSYTVFDDTVGFSQAPTAAKLDITHDSIGEDKVSRVWRFQGSRPVVAAGILFDTSGDKLEASSVLNGGLLWSWQDTKGYEGERRLTPPAVANGRVWAGTWDGRILSWDAKSGDVRWTVNIGAPCHWQPAIFNGKVYVGLENGTLVAFHTTDLLDNKWPMWGGGPGHNGN